MTKATRSVIRGLPGSGKTTLATYAAANRSNVKIVTTDTDNKGCDEACRRQVLAALENSGNGVLHNLFLRHKSTLAYQFIAIQSGAEYDVVDLFDAGLTDAELARRTKRPHVDAQSIQALRSEYERYVARKELTSPRKLHHTIVLSLYGEAYDCVLTHRAA